MAGPPFWIRFSSHTDPVATDLFLLSHLKKHTLLRGTTKGLQFVQFNFSFDFGFASGYLKTPTTINPGFLDGLPPPPTPLTLNEFASPAFYILPFKRDFKTKPMMEN